MRSVPCVLHELKVKPNDATHFRPCFGGQTWDPNHLGPVLLPSLRGRKPSICLLLFRCGTPPALPELPDLFRAVLGPRGVGTLTGEKGWVDKRPLRVYMFSSLDTSLSSCLGRTLDGQHSAPGWQTWLHLILAPCWQSWKGSDTLEGRLSNT